MVRERLDVFEHLADFAGLCAEQLRAPTEQDPTPGLHTFHRVYVVVGGFQGLYDMADTCEFMGTMDSHIYCGEHSSDYVMESIHSAYKSNDGEEVK